jgi:hypothetical protein
MVERVAMAIALVALGCGGPPPAAQRVLSATAVGVVQTDLQLAPRVRAAGQACLSTSASWSEFDSCVAPWATAVAALRAVAQGLLALQSAHDAWVSGTDDGAIFLDSVPCIVDALARLARALEAASVPVPPLIPRALQLAQAFGGRCG